MAAEQYELNVVAIEQFHDLFITDLQQRQHKLAGTTLLRTGIVGKSYQWPLADSVDMRERTGGPLSNIPNTNVDYGTVITVFKEWDLKLSTDIFTQAEVNVSELASFSKQHADAQRRRQDQMILDALDASTTSLVIDADSTNMTFKKLKHAAKLARKNNWPEGTWHVAMHASQWDSLLDETKVTSSDYNTQRVLNEGSISGYLGFTFHIFGDLTTGGLPLDGNDIRTCFAWHENYVGAVYSINPTVRIFPMNEDLVVPTTSWFKGGADVLRQDAVIKIKCDESEE